MKTLLNGLGIALLIGATTGALSAATPRTMAEVQAELFYLDPYEVGFDTAIDALLRELADLGGLH